MGLLTTLEQKQTLIPGETFWPIGVIPLGLVSGNGKISHDEAVSSTAVWAALTMIAGVVATLPLKLNRKTGPDSREPVSGHPVSEVLNFKASRWMKATPFKEATQTHLLMRGTSYAQKLTDRGGRIQELVLLHPEAMTVKIEDKGLRYEYNDSRRGSLKFGPDEVLHITGPTSNGITGWDVVALMRNAIALTIATERHGQRLFTNAGRPGGIVSTDMKLGPDKRQEFRQEWDATFSGENAHKTAVLDQGLKWQAMGFTSEEAQFLETRKFQVSEVARIWNIPPHLLKDLDRATFSNIEQQAIEFAQFTIRPWLRRWEEALAVDLLTREEREDGLFFKFTIEDILAADIKTRFEAYSVATGGMPWMTTNQVRALEDMNPQDGGDELWAPLNMLPRSLATSAVLDGGEGNPPSARRSLSGEVTLDKRLVGKLLGEELTKQREARLVLMRRRSRSLMRNLVRGQAVPLLERELEAGRRALARSSSAGEFIEWIREFYRDWGPRVATAMLPVLHAHADSVERLIRQEIGPGDEIQPERLEGFLNAYARGMGERWEARHSTRLETSVTEAGDSYAQPVTEKFDAWEATAAESIANEEAVRFDGGVSRTIYALAGIIAYRWTTIGDNCPMCNAMSGTVVAQNSPYLRTGEVFDVEGAEPLMPSHDIRHPPLHAGCDCLLLAGI